MLNSLDLLVIAFALLSILGLLSIIMMFTQKSICIKKVFFYIAVAIVLYSAYGGIRMFWPLFMGQAFISIILGLVGIISAILVSVCKNNEKPFLIARIVTSVSFILSLVNNFFI